MIEEATFYTYLGSPVGKLLLAGHSAGLCEIRFMDVPGAEPHEAAWREDDAPFADVVAQLRDYFDGKLREFDVQLAPKGTPFQLEVWKALREIPYGDTISYAELARRIGKPTAVRAVGAANGKNPLSIVVPCHRVIGSDGSLTGYGGGLRNKEYLLALEQRVAEYVSGMTRRAVALQLPLD
ncbi:MAG TPA: methylated-DNA--[protein]-cysteine S-methyltransferase [Blastocatellia bacterium]|nr:methylated-DNA--[protein]-cysteine S-methyltransferase [Blastocatellia bacterium]